MYFCVVILHLQCFCRSSFSAICPLCGTSALEFYLGSCFLCPCIFLSRLVPIVEKV
ncbi:hypothetical protein XENTR_v10005962 [Xenopus tropicalis]|nr:hypothetical protein XENTR_v10005962 [Xenopus tropicalis]